MAARPRRTVSTAAGRAGAPKSPRSTWRLRVATRRWFACFSAPERIRPSATACTTATRSAGPSTFNSRRSCRFSRITRRTRNDQLTPACGVRTGLGDAVTESPEIVGRVRRPSDVHQPRDGRSMQEATSSWSSSRPSRAEKRPFSTSRLNHPGIRKPMGVEFILGDWDPVIGHLFGLGRIE